MAELEDSRSLQENTRSVSDVQFMEEIRKYEAIYDKSCKGFQDKRVKANCWKRIAESLGMNMSEAERRYKTIRTAFSRYLSKISGKSGSGTSEVASIDPKYEHMRWLMLFIKSRQSFSNLSTTRLEEEPKKDEQEVGYEMSEASLSTIDEPEETNSNQHFDGTFNKAERVQTQSPEVPVKGRPVPTSTEMEEISLKKRKKNPSKNWIGSNVSAKAELEQTDSDIKQAILSLDKTLEVLNKSSNSQEMDEDSYYCNSLASRLRRLDRRRKAIARNRIEAVLLDVEFGFPCKAHQTLTCLKGEETPVKFL